MRIPSVAILCMTICRCQKASVDEAYLEPDDMELPLLAHPQPAISPARLLLARAEMLAHHIQDSLKRNLQYDCSIAISTNKLLAKVLISLRWHVAPFEYPSVDRIPTGKTHRNPDYRRRKYHGSAILHSNLQATGLWAVFSNW